MNCQECRNAILLEIVHIRRSSRKILDAHGCQDRAPVIPAILNINHDLNSMENHIEECRRRELEGEDQAARRLAVDSIPR